MKQFSLRHHDREGVLKRRLTTHGQILALTSDMILYSGDDQYGTMINLKKTCDSGESFSFEGAVLYPSQDAILKVLDSLDTVEKASGSSWGAHISESLVNEIHQ